MVMSMWDCLIIDIGETSPLGAAPYRGSLSFKERMNERTKGRKEGGRDGGTEGRRDRGRKGRTKGIKKKARKKRGGKEKKTYLSMNL